MLSSDFKITVKVTKLLKLILICNLKMPYFFLLEKQAETNATAQHFRNENEKLQRQIGDLQQHITGLKAEVSRLGSLEATNRSLQEQVNRHAGRLSEAQALGKSCLLVIAFYGRISCGFCDCSSSVTLRNSVKSILYFLLTSVHV